MPSTLYCAWEGSKEAGSHRRYYYKVDDFTGDKDIGVDLFFCTHAHADHLGGLCDGWDKGRIVASRETIMMLVRRFPALDARLPHWKGGGRRLLEMDINPLQSNELFLDHDRTVRIAVTLICANHCPGRYASSVAAVTGL